MQTFIIEKDNLSKLRNDAIWALGNSIEQQSHRIKQAFDLNLIEIFESALKIDANLELVLQLSEFLVSLFEPYEMKYNNKIVMLLIPLSNILQSS